MSTNTNKLWKDVTISIHRHEVDVNVSIGQKHTIVQPPSAPPVAKKPWTSDEVTFVIVIPLAMIALIIIGYQSLHKPKRNKLAESIFWWR